MAGDDGVDGLDAPLIPFDKYSICKGMREVVLSNLSMGCRAEDILDIVLHGMSIKVNKGFLIKNE